MVKEGRGTLEGGTRDGFRTDREFSSDSDKVTRRQGDKEKIFLIFDFGMF